MKKIFVGLIICTNGFLFAQLTHDLNSIGSFSNDINSGSARYIGMGGAMGALGGDLSSTEQNPAGLAVAITSDLNVTMGISSFNNKSKFGQNFKSKDNTFDFQNFAGTFVFHNPTGAWNRFSIGLKYSEENLDNWISLGRNDNITATLLTNENPEEFTTYTMNGYQDMVEGYKSKVSLNFGASYKDQLYLGLGFNFHDVRYNNYVVFDEDTNGTVYRYDLNGTPYSARATGISLSAGIIEKIQDNLRLGLAYHSPTWYNDIEESYFADIQLNNGNFAYNHYYSEYDRNSNNRLVASAAWVFGKSLAINADYTYHFNGSTKYKPKRFFSATNKSIRDNYKNSSEIRVGGEYRIEQFRLRAGYSFIETPFDDIQLMADRGNGTPVDQKFSNTFQGDINRFSLGAGYDFGGFYIDAAYQFQNQKYNYVFGNGEYIDFDGGENTVYQASLPMNAKHNYMAEVKNKKGLFLLTAGWQF